MRVKFKSLEILLLSFRINRSSAMNLSKFQKRFPLSPLHPIIMLLNSRLNPKMTLFFQPCNKFLLSPLKNPKQNYQRKSTSKTHNNTCLNSTLKLQKNKILIRKFKNLKRNFRSYKWQSRNLTPELSHLLQSKTFNKLDSI